MVDERWSFTRDERPRPAASIGAAARPLIEN
jgi:hypothetical protein